jgi:cold shock CspA family protein
MRGKMLWFNEVKDIGAICAEDGEHLSVHGAHFAPGAKPEGRCGGTVVDFRLVEDETERRAEHVTLVPELMQGRARQRRTPRAIR